MKSFFFGTKIFAVLFLLFVNSIPAFAQSDDSLYRLAPETRLTVRMDTAIGSGINAKNDTFTVTLTKPVIVREIVVLPAGAVIEGRVVSASRSALGRRNGKLELQFENIRFASGEARKIDGELSNRLKIGSGTVINTVSILGGTAAGLAIGSASGSSSRAWIGAGIGAGVGAGVAFLRKGSDVGIKTGEEFEIVLKKELILPVTDY